MDYILDRPEDFSAIILVSMLLIDVIRSYIANQLDCRITLVSGIQVPVRSSVWKQERPRRP
jgi:hypothetical protein